MKRILLVSLLFTSAVAVLVWVGVVEASIPVLGIHELTSAEYPGGQVQVDDGEVLAIESLAPLKFTVAPRKNPALVLRVESQRSVPENFKPGIQVSVRGEYLPQEGIFRAYRITTKCPSKYEASKQVKEPGAEQEPSA